MLHQVQYYDLQDTSKRQVIATIDGLANETEIVKWQNEVILSNPVPDGQGFFVTPENNPWFIRQDDTHALVQIPNIDAQSDATPTGEVELLPYDVCGAIQLKLDEERRIAEIEYQEKLEKHIASFQG